MTQPDLAKAAGIPLDTYKKYEGGRVVPGGDALAALSRAGVNVIEVLVGDMGGDLLKQMQVWSARLADELKAKQGHPNAQPPHVEQLRSGYVYLPLYEVRASAGGGAIIESESIVDLLAFKEDWLRQELNAGPADVALLFVQGRSMEPDLRPGDVIMIDRRDTTAQREAIYVIRMDGAVLVKELQRLPGGVIKVRSKNPDYEPFERTINDIEVRSDFAVIGRVIWACRRF